MSLKICNLQGVTDALFREFLSQPGERQWCSEILRSITKGERVETKDFLKLSSDTPPRSSPRSSPVNSPRNHAHLSPLLLPPSPRSPVSPLPQSLNSGLLFSRNSGQPGSASAASGTTPQSSTAASSSSPNSVGFSSVTNFFSTSLANEARPSTPTSSLGRKHNWRRDGIASPPSPASPATARQIEAPPPATQETKSLTYVRENSAAHKENARPLPTSPPTTPVSPLSPPTPQGSVSTTSATITPGVAHNAHPAPGSPVGVVPSAPAPLQSPRATNTIRRHTKATKNLLIPRFYYPMGRPTTQVSQEQSISRVNAVFRENGGQITRDNMEPLIRACQVPLYWKAPLFIAAGGDKLGYLTQEQFSDYWSRVISTCHDMASRFVRVLSRGVRNYLMPEDFLSMIQDVVDTHPGLTFLKEATEFHSRYVHTVIARIYYCVNRSWSGRITVPELRRSNLLQVISYLEEEEDINQITDYFSYEHFYVIYCKFWELDTDHDLFIDKHDLAKHNERALSWRMIERIFSGAVTRGRLQKQDRMGYQEFVWFLISEEDKRHPTAIEYWFRCMDLDGDGYLSMYELEYFYEEQLQRMEALGIETLPFHDCLCQMLDMVRPEMGDKISLRDLKRCRMTPIFFDTFFNLEKYLDHEQRDPFASHRAEDDGPEVSEWDRYAAEEYELLVAEEGGADHQDDMFYGDEDELSMGCDDALDSSPGGGRTLTGGVVGGGSVGGGLNKHSPLSATVTNLAADSMDVDDDYPDYADSDDYQY